VRRPPVQTTAIGRSHVPRAIYGSVVATGATGAARNGVVVAA
jgi:hypothetical protein